MDICGVKAPGFVSEKKKLSFTGCHLECHLKNLYSSAIELYTDPEWRNKNQACGAHLFHTFIIK